MLVGLTHAVSPHLPDCELTFVDREPIDYHLAVEQHDNYCAALRRCGVEVKKLSANLSHPDACFVEDTAVVLDELAVITSMGAASRRGETAAIAYELAKHRELVRILLPATIEGGDVLVTGRRVFVGLSGRTNALGVKELMRTLEPRGYDVRPIKMSGCLHLKTACTALDDETLLVNPRWVDVGQLGGYRIFFTPDDEPYAANTLRVGERLLVQAGSPRTTELVRRHDDRVEVVEISEFLKAEAGLSCLVLIFRAAG